MFISIKLYKNLVNLINSANNELLKIEVSSRWKGKPANWSNFHKKV